MPSIFTYAAVAAGLLASTVSARGNVAIYWGQGAYQKELSVVCEDPSVDIVNIGFVNGFPKSRSKYPDTNFGNACGGSYFTNPDGTQSKLLASCDIITRGIKTCKANGKKVLLSLGGGYPADYYLDNVDAYKWLAEVLVGSFGAVNTTASPPWPRPFGDAVVDGFDLDIESTSGSGNYQWQMYGDFVNYLKKLPGGKNMLISAAPQCIVPDAHLDDAIYRAPFDYIFTQFYNTASCSAKLGYQQLKQATTGFTFDAWVTRLKQRSKNPEVKLYLGLPAGENGANAGYYLKPEEANALITEYQKRDLWGGVMLWEATVSQNNTNYCNSYSTWIKSSLDGTFSSKYKPSACSVTSTRSSSTLVSSTKTSSSIRTSSTASSTKITSSASSSKSSSIAPSTKSSSTLVSSTLKSSSTPAVSSTYSASSSAVVSSSSYHASSSAVVSSSSVHVSASSSVASSSVASSSVASSSVASSSAVVSSSSVYVSASSSVASSSVASSSVASSSVYVTSSASSVEYSASSSSVAPSETSSVQYSDYFSTAIPTEHSASSTAEPSTVYPEDVSSTVVHSSSSADVTSSASSYYETSSTPEVTSSASSYYETSSVPEVTSSASDYYSASSSTPAVSSTKSASEYSSSSTLYDVSSSTVYDVSSSTTPVGASSTSCTTSTELYPESSKTPEASSSASGSLSYSESSKIPETSSSVSESYFTESTKTPEASTVYSASSTTPIGASSTPCTTSTELYPESSKIPEASSSASVSLSYSESSKTPEASTATEYSYYSESSVVSSKTPEASSSDSEYILYSSSAPVVSSKATEYIVVYPTPVESTKTPDASEYELYSTATPTVTKPAESTTTVVTTTYLDTCSTGLTTKTTVITKTVCNACAKHSDKPEADYPEDWTTSVYVSKTLTVTITKPIHPATDVPAYPTGAISSESHVAPKPSAPAAEYPVGKEEVPSYETPAKSSSVPYEATKPSPKPEVPSYPEVPAEKPSSKASSLAAYPTKPAVPSYPEDATVTVSQYVTLTKVASTPVAYATPVQHQGYPAGNDTASSAPAPYGTGAVKPSTTGGYYAKPSVSAPAEFTGAASKLSMGMTGVVAVVAFFML